MILSNRALEIKKDALQHIEERVNTITFGVENYDSPFVLKDVSQPLKSSFKYLYVQEKQRELKFLRDLVLLMDDPK